MELILRKTLTLIPKKSQTKFDLKFDLKSCIKF